MTASCQTRVALLGGDAREEQVLTTLGDHGFQVVYAGRPPSTSECRAQWVADAGEALVGANLIILPMRGMGDDGRVSSAYLDYPVWIKGEDLAQTASEARLVVGVASQHLRQLADTYGITVIELADDDEVAILNSIPTAEGAIQMAMELTPITIHSSRCLVLGYGRCGVTLARALAGLGARVSVAARKPRDLARILEAGYRPVCFSEFHGALPEMDLIFNTVPRMILDRTALGLVGSEAVIIDLASAPGGCDFDAARSLGRQAVLAPGLPGKVAPVTAGQIIARRILRILKEEPSAAWRGEGGCGNA
ncbi:MAG: dipicolinate synthase subunit DpsA [Bacillota bacterium]